MRGIYFSEKICNYCRGKWSRKIDIVSGDGFFKKYVENKYGRDNSSDVIRAGKIAVSKINHYFEIGESFNQESTLCGRSIIKNIKRARMCGYRIELHYVGVDSVDIAKKRIAQRGANGGHGIPDKDVERRHVGLTDLLSLNMEN